MFDNSQFFSGGAAGFYDFPLEQSLRFNDDDSADLRRSPASAGDQKTWTYSGWFKRSNLGITAYLITDFASSTNRTRIRISSDDRLRYDDYNGSQKALYDTAQLFRDPSAWYHVVVAVDTTDPVNTERVKIYVNGQRVTDFASTPTHYSTQNYDTSFNRTSTHYIGSTTSGYFDGYMAEVNFLNGIAATADDFGELKSGVWIPKEYTGAYDSAAQVTAGNLNGFRITGAEDGVNAFYDYTGNFTSKSVGSGLAHTADEAKWGASSINSEPSNATYTITGTNGDLYPSGSNDRTFEAWVYYDNTGSSDNNLRLFYSFTSDFFNPNIFIDGGNQNVRVGNQTNGGSNLYYLSSSSPLSSGWNHVAVTYENKTGTIFLNGNQVGQYTWSSGTFGDAGNIEIGSTSACDRFPYMDDVRISSGLRYTGSTYTVPTSEFVEDADTLFMLKSDYSPSTAVGADSSGNNNHWTDNNLTHFDVVLDSPTDNFCTLNPLDNTGVLSDGNLRFAGTADSTYRGARATFALPSTGMWYWENKIEKREGSRWNIVGMVTPSVNLNAFTGAVSGAIIYGSISGVNRVIYNETSLVSNSATIDFDVGDVVQCAYDAGTGKFWFGLNNSWWDSSVGTTGDPATGANPTLTVDTSKEWFPFVQCSDNNNAIAINFGQQPFKYDPPA